MKTLESILSPRNDSDSREVTRRTRSKRLFAFVFVSAVLDVGMGLPPQQSRVFAQQSPQPVMSAKEAESQAREWLRERFAESQAELSPLGAFQLQYSKTTKFLASADEIEKGDRENAAMKRAIQGKPDHPLRQKVEGHSALGPGKESSTVTTLWYGQISGQVVFRRSGTDQQAMPSFFGSTMDQTVGSKQAWTYVPMGPNESRLTVNNSNDGAAQSGVRPAEARASVEKLIRMFVYGWPFVWRDLPKMIWDGASVVNDGVVFEGIDERGHLAQVTVVHVPDHNEFVIRRVQLPSSEFELLSSTFDKTFGRIVSSRIAYTIRGANGQVVRMEMEFQPAERIDVTALGAVTDVPSFSQENPDPVRGVVSDFRWTDARLQDPTRRMPSGTGATGLQEQLALAPSQPSPQLTMNVDDSSQWYSWMRILGYAFMIVSCVFLAVIVWKRRQPRSKFQ